MSPPGKVLHLVLILIFISDYQVQARKYSQNRILLISLDGFHYSLIEKFNLLNFQKLANQGLSAPSGLTSLFTTKTLPVHWSLATGKYQDQTGFVGNYFFDPKLNKTFKTEDKDQYDDKDLYQDEPIWTSARKSGIKTGVIDWIGSESNLWKPELSVPYLKKRSFEERLNLAFDWFVDKAARLVLLYHDEPDSQGHAHGAESTQVREVLEQIDKNLHSFVHKLEGHPNLKTKLSIIILSDHGMVNISDSRKIYLDRYLDLNSYAIYHDLGTVSNIFARNQSSLELIFDTLKNSKIEGLEVFKKSDIPENWNYKNNVRIGDIVLVAQEGYFILDQDPAKIKDGDKVWNPQLGQHGYDNHLEPMRPLFIASGYNFLPESILNDSQVETINVHSLVAHLLRFEIPPGCVSDWTVFDPYLKNHEHLSSASLKLVPSYGNFLGVLCVICYYVTLNKV